MKTTWKSAMCFLHLFDNFPFFPFNSLLATFPWSLVRLQLKITVVLTVLATVLTRSQEEAGIWSTCQFPSNMTWRKTPPCSTCFQSWKHVSSFCMGAPPCDHISQCRETQSPMKSVRGITQGSEGTGCPVICFYVAWAYPGCDSRAWHVSPELRESAFQICSPCWMFIQCRAQFAKWDCTDFEVERNGF